MLHYERNRLERIAVREAAGEDLWSSKFSANLRTKIAFLMNDTTNLATFYPELARKLIMRDIGLETLSSWGANYPVEDFYTFLKDCDDEFIPTIIEAFIIALKSGPKSSPSVPNLAQFDFTNRISTLLSQYRIAYQLADDSMIPLSSFELHDSVVEPAVRLLSRTSGWESVEKAYLDALDEIGTGKAGNAITDSATALQEALIILGCEGNALGPLISSGIRKGIVAAHDKPMLDSIEKLMHWVSADRSILGDAHNSAEPALEDAWLSVHVVGAILVRLNRQTLRARPMI
ncbi:MAG: hypothetical protein Q8K86_07670 [Candidatus Nanopelagicaceae bacterium]|nr:hypothetical protein [Candidatus Nanopelagicaceae bacterium]